MNSLQTIALRAITNPIEEAKRLHEKHPLTHTLKIHFSELAKKYGTSEKTKVGNMVVNEFVLRNDVHLETFKNDPLPLPLLRRMIHFQECGFRKAFRGDHNTSVLHKCSHKGNLKKTN
ncbi:unnamed protein product [Porites evermanni]|uniref:Uncharacterized protein n=1 Tax=Porites evermanni TaxID=104178 RepID=A0ABN8SLV7_9CNID|nr:unnamed protein product [Porites evermanni]